MTIGPEAGLAIFLMAAVTIGLKLGGVFVMRSVPLTPFLERFFAHLPGTLLISLIVPMALAAGPSGIVGTLAAVGIVVRGGGALLAVMVAAGIAIAWRIYIG
ncbi:MAG: AzlD domain-containing protein [Pseudomonadota bacterium]